MPDIFSSEKRSEIMSKISGKETKPEIMVRKYLFAYGFRFRKNDKRFPGKPDIVLPKYKTIIFINGCFWHGHENCKKSKLPGTRKDFWENKINSNIIRDQQNINDLKSMGWSVIIVWQCKLGKDKEQTLSNLVDQILLDNNGN
ncbi:very short patch repair endonuclease [Chryseobacterium paludis]|uniref:very short patch repair endonuclease n=1 Tax=Chryseobacterium paludis TaxID=2956784 RepID=UPI0021C136C1|nr:very short patch repair endonuclease [Chryseobacterium paludis]